MCHVLKYLEACRFSLVVLGPREGVLSFLFLWAECNELSKATISAFST